METSEVYQLLEGWIDEKKDSEEEDGLKIYHIRPREEREDRERGFRVFSIGQPSDQPTRCVLVLGETGAGKTTFINAAINHLFGVRFEDPFRLQVKEETEDDRMETESQTDLITAYTINYKEGMKHKYNFVLIDTPGLADTRKAQQPRDIRSHLEEFITSDFGIHDLHCVGLVANATKNKDLKSEKAVLGEIISLLGEAVPEITHIFATFAVDKPMVDAVVKNAGVQYKSMFNFDNGTLYTPPKTNTSSEKQQFYLSYRWDIMNEQYEACFDAFANATPLSLKLIRERKHFDTCKKNLKAQIEKLATSVTEMEINKNIYINFEQQRANNNDWSQIKHVYLREDQHALNCNLCQQTCIIFRDNNSDTTGSSGARLLQAVGTTAGIASAVPKSGTSNFNKLGVLGIAVAAGVALVSGFFIAKKKKENLNEAVCGENGCSHTIKQHAKESRKLQISIDENMKKLYDEAISKTEDAKTKIINGQQEILSCSTTISHITVKLLNHAKTIEEMIEQDFVSIKDLSSHLKNEIKLGEGHIIPQATNYIVILTEAMERLLSYTAEEILGKHEFIKEMLLSEYENFF